MAQRPDLSGVRLPAIRLSDRLLQRLRRVAAGHPYLAGSIVLHALLIVLLMNVAAFDAQEADARLDAHPRGKMT